MAGETAAILHGGVWIRLWIWKIALLHVLGRDVKQLTALTGTANSVTDMSSEAIWAEIDALEGAAV